jgi:hypothetical protein
MARHQGGLDEAKPRQVHVWTMAYAVRNRVHGGLYHQDEDSAIRDTFTSQLRAKACDQSVADFLPREGD